MACLEFIFGNDCRVSKLNLNVKEIITQSFKSIDGGSDSYFRKASLPDKLFFS